MSKVHRAAAAVVAGTGALAVTGVVVLSPGGSASATTASAQGTRSTTSTSGAGDSGNGKNKGGGNQDKNLVLSGDVAGLVPGEQVSYVVQARNDNKFDVRIKTLTATVTDVFRDGVSIMDICAPSNLTAPTVVSLRLATPGVTSQDVRIGLIENADDDCQDAVFELAYSATVEKK